MAKGFFQDTETVLFDTTNDPNQMSPVDDPDIARRLSGPMLNLMQANDAPPEVYRRFGLDPGEAQT